MQRATFEMTGRSVRSKLSREVENAMTSSGLDELRTALLANALPGQHPRELLKAVRRSHPKASKSEVVRAAFHTVIDLADGDSDKVRILHDFAIAARGELN